MAPQAAVVSYRLGGSDGVSVEARKWAWALGELGFEVRRVAGAIGDAGAPDDVVVPGLTIQMDGAVDPAALSGTIEDAIDGADLVIVENVTSLPLNVDAARAVTRAVENTRARLLLRHHDLPWQRRNLALVGERVPAARARRVARDREPSLAARVAGARLRRGAHGPQLLRSRPVGR